MPQEKAVRRRFARLQAQLTHLEALADDDDALAERRPKVSAWSVGDHVEHLLIVDRAVLAGIAKNLDGDHEGHGKPSRAGRIVLAVGRFRRGLGKAPKAVRPRHQAPPAIRDLAADIRNRLDRLAGRVGEIATATTTRKHPVFGQLTPFRWLRLAAIHHDHHLRIVKDIRR